MLPARLAGPQPYTTVSVPAPREPDILWASVTSRATTRLRAAGVSILAIALFGWFLRGASLGDVWRHVQSADPRGLLAGLACVATMYVLRAIRWQYLLRPIGPTRYRTAFRTTVIGFAALGLLPARAGDVLRPYLLARREGLNVPATFATVLMERVLDLVAVLALLAVFVWGYSSPATLPPHLRGPVELTAIIGGICALALLAFMWGLASHPERVGRVVCGASRMLPASLAARIGEGATMFSTGFAAAREPRSLLLALLWSFPLWLTIALEAYAVTRAFGIAMPLAGSFLLQAILVIGVAVPTPGAVGGYHEAYRLGVTTFFGASNSTAVAAAIVVHAISFVPVVLTGIVFMAQDGLRVGGLQHLAEVAREEERPHPDEVPLLRQSGR